MVNWPARSRGLTLLTYFYCGTFLVWIGVEDYSLAAVTVLGAGLPALFLGHFLLRRFGGAVLSMRKSLLLLSAGGLLAGALAPLAIAILMAVKVSLHGSTTPGFEAQTVVAVVARLPVWALAGLLVGVALALFVYARREREGQGG